MMIIIFLTMLALNQGQEELSVLRPGETIQDAIAEGNPGIHEVHTPSLDADSKNAPAMGKTYRIQITEDGPYHIDLVSYFFNAYLILRDDEGAVLLEDDNGLLSTHARLQMRLVAGAHYHIDCCALQGGMGPYELKLVRGSIEKLSGPKLAKAEIENARNDVIAKEAYHGSDDLEVVSALNGLGYRLWRSGRFDEALLVMQRALRIVESSSGSDHPRTGFACVQVAAQLRGAGRFDEARLMYERALKITENFYGPDYHIIAKILDGLADVLQVQYKFSEARSLHERALAIREKTLGPDHPDVAMSLNSLGQLHKAEGNYAEALQLYERTLEILEKAVGPEHRDVAVILNSLGSLYFDQGAYAEARSLYERALVILEEALGLDHVDVATTLNNLATVLEAQSDLAGALSLFERSLAIREKTLGFDHIDIAQSLNNIAVLLQKQGAYTEARPLHERALKIREKTFGPDHPHVALSLNNLGLVLYYQGAYAEARPLYERALAINEVLGPDHIAVATSLRNLAVLLKTEGNYGEARPLLERSLAIWEKTFGPDHPRVAESLNNMAVLLIGQGDYGEARPLYERALAIREKTYGPEHPAVAESLTGLARRLEDQGAYGEARPLYERALAIREKALGSEHPAVANSLIMLAGLLQHEGDYGEARRLYERALVIRENALGPEHPSMSDGLSLLGWLLYRQGDVDGARTLMERAMMIVEKTWGADHFDKTFSLSCQALIAADGGDTRLALELSRRSIKSVRAHIDRILWSMSESERIRYVRKVRPVIEFFLSIAKLDAPADAARTREAYEAVLTWKGQVSRSLLEDGPLRMRSLPVHERVLVERLRGVQKRLSDLLYDTDIGDPDQREERLKNLRKERNRLELELARARREEVDTGKEEVRIEDDEEWRALVEHLPPGSAAVDFLVHQVYVPYFMSDKDEEERWNRFLPPHLFAWILKAGEEEIQWIDLGEAALVEKAVGAFLTGTTGDWAEQRGLVRKKAVDGGVKTTPDNDHLRELLWNPLAGTLGGAERIFISPDSFLGTLPFETLQLPDGTYLLEHHAFVYLQDMVSLARMSRKPEASEPTLLVAGGIDYSGRSALPEGTDDEAPPALLETRGGFRTNWKALSWTNLEADAVASVYDRAFGTESRRLVIKRDEATEERIKLEMPHWPYIHLATHGFFQPEGLTSMWDGAQEGREGLDGIMLERGADREITGLLPGLLSGLVFAGANAEPEPGRDNGLLTAEETTYLDLSRCELVVLSACETALGRSEAGEGMMGLRRSFRQAGAKTVISSLWQVRDEATSNLMIAFYGNLWLEKMGKHEALREAQLAMLTRNRVDYGEGLPSTWGAFVLDGDWR